MSFLTPLAFLAALIAIPIILLYMLRLRRRELLVSSNFLWQQIIRDKEANTPWQRLRRNLLMILQLIILALLVLALARPAQIVPTITAGKTVILLDASASMNARDMDGRSRFEVAKEEALRILSEAGSGDEISVIRVAELSEPLIAYSNDFNAVRSAINSAQAGQGRGDWDTALTLAAAGAEGAESFSIIIISDGGLGLTARLPENIPQPTFIPVGTASNNLALSALATASLAGQNPQLFAQVQNFAPVDNEISLLIRLDGELWDSLTQTVSANSQRSFVFNVDEDFSSIEAELILDNAVIDYLTVDNKAYTVTASNESRRVLLVSNQQNIFIEQAFRSIPNVQTFRGDETRPTLPDSPYDLYVFNGYLPAVLPDADMLIINPPRDSELFTVGADVTETSPIRLENRSHPVSAFLNVENVNLRRFRSVSNADWAQALVTANEQALILIGETQGRQVMLMPFNLLESDLPLQIAFPLLISNAVQWFAPANIVSGGTSYTVGDVLRINPPVEATRVSISKPDGTSIDLIPTGLTLSFADTLTAGFYRVDIYAGDTVLASQLLAFNVFGIGESDLQPRDASSLAVGGGLQAADAEAQFGFQEFWQALAFIALLVLMLEWYLHHRRLQLPNQAPSPLRRTTARER